MDKCHKCGREYEGKYCPYCGEKFSMVRKNKVIDKVLFITYSPLCLAVFAVVMLGLFETSVSSALGSVYFLSGEWGEFVGLRSLMIACIVVACLAFAYAAAVFVLRDTKLTECKYIRFSDQAEIKIDSILDCLCFTFYLAFLAFGIAVTVLVKKLQVKVGICPILIIVLSIVFVIAEYVHFLIKRNGSEQDAMSMTSGSCEDGTNSLISYLPIIILVLTAGMMFGFFAAPVSSGVISGYKLFGDLGKLLGMRDLIIACVVIAGVSVIYAAVTFVLKITNITNTTNINLFGVADIKLSVLLDCFGCAFYLGFLVLGSIMCSKVVSFKLSVKACSILLIVFSVVCAFAAFVSFVLTEYFNIMNIIKSQHEKK